MKHLLRCFALVVFTVGWAPLSAQTATPARPVDPHQAMPVQPAQPVQPSSPAPVTNAPSTNTNAPSEAPVPTVTIMADSSLKEVLQDLAQNWSDSLDPSPQVPLVLTNAGTLRARTEAGTAGDLVIGPDLQDMKELTDKGFLLADGQRTVARNALVIYGRKALVKDDELDWFDLVGSEWKKVALGNPDLVASGRFAKKALQKHGLIDDAHKNTYAYAGTETLVLQIAEREQADAVFVYKTDITSAPLPGFEMIILKSDDAPPVFYMASVTKGAKNPSLARSFMDYCIGEAAREIWAKHGFETN